MKNFIGKIIGAFTPPRDGKEFHDEPIVQGGKFNNKMFIHQLVEQFKNELDDLSVGQRMLYPMSFNILLHPDDLVKVEQSLPFLFPELLVQFYAIIRERSQEYPKYDGPAKRWVFKVSSSDVDEIPQTSGGVLLIQKGKLTTISSLYTRNSNDNNHGNKSQNVRVSLCISNSNVEDYGDINLDAHNIMGNSRFVYQFDKSLPTDSDAVLNVDNMKTLATLSYTMKNVRVEHNMKFNEIFISGNNDLRDDDDVIKIDSNTIMNSHALIRYQPENNSFKIAVFGKTIVNEKNLQVSSGSNIVWYDLSKRSDIFINNEVTLKFEAKV